MTNTRHLRSAEHLIAPEVAKTIQSLTGESLDAAVIRLAEQYAEAIDAVTDQHVRASVLEKLGPKLLAVLVELGATPRARAAALKGGAPDGQSELDRLRAARQA